MSAERAELEASIMGRLTLMESESEALRQEISEGQERSSNVSVRGDASRRCKDVACLGAWASYKYADS